MAPAVTPAGVRDGDPAALAGLCAARGPSVVAYCRHVAGEAGAGAAAADAFGRFRASVVTSEDLGALNPEALLLAATRSAAATHSMASADGPCAEVPALLAARANRTISLEDVERLEGHLETCWTCRAPVERLEAAERAYRDPPDPAMDPLVVAQIIAAMAAAGPMLATTAPAAPAANGHRPEGAPVIEPPAATGDAPVAGAALDQPTAERSSPDAVVPGTPAAVPVEPEPPAAAPIEPEPQVEPPAAVRVAPPAQEAPVSPPGPQDEPPPPPGAGPPAAGAFGNSRLSRRPAGTRRRKAVIGARNLSSQRDEPASAREDQIAPAPPGEPRRRRLLRAGAAAPGAMGTRLPRARRPPPPPADAISSGGRRRSLRSRRLPAVLPIAVVLGALLVALFVSGVVGGGDPASSPRVDVPADAAPADDGPADVVVVPGAGEASADEVEEAKARERARAKRRREAAAGAARSESPSRPATAIAQPAPVVAPPPPPPPATQASQRGDNRTRSGSREIEAGNGATGSEQIPPPADTSTVPDLAPPPEPTASP